MTQYTTYFNELVLSLGTGEAQQGFSLVGGRVVGAPPVRKNLLDGVNVSLAARLNQVPEKSIHNTLVENCSTKIQTNYYEYLVNKNSQSLIKKFYFVSHALHAYFFTTAN